MRTACVCALAACVLALGACGRTGGVKNPVGGAQAVTVSTQPNFGGSLKDLASEVTMNVILRHKGAKFVQSVPFQPCPGEAGLQTFILHSGGGVSILEVAFSNWSGNAVTAEYRRPQNAPYSKQALDAMRRAVCSS